MYWLEPDMFQSKIGWRRLTRNRDDLPFSIVAIDPYNSFRKSSQE